LSPYSSIFKDDGAPLWAMAMALSARRRPGPAISSRGVAARAVRAMPFTA
jgi:hypothetical protein